MHRLNQNTPLHRAAAVIIALIVCALSLYLRGRGYMPLAMMIVAAVSGLYAAFRIFFLIVAIED